MNKGFSKRRYIVIFYILMVMPTLVLGIWTYIEGRENLYKSAETNLKYVTEDTKIDLELYFNDFGYSLDTMSQFPLIKSIIVEDREQEIVKVLKNFISYHPIVSQIYIGLEDERFIVASHNDMYIPEGYDPRTRPWYVLAKEKQSLGWTEIYESVDGERMITAAVPIFDDRKLIGVLAADFTLQDIAKRLAKQYINNNENLMVLDNNFNVLYHTQDKYVGKQVEAFNSFFDDYGNSGFAEVKYNILEPNSKGDMILYYTTDQNVNLIIASYIQGSTLINESMKILIRTIIILIFTLTLLSAFFLFTFRLNRKYTHLKQAHQKLKKESNIDPLTGVYNRRYYLDIVKEKLNYSHYVVMMIDIDHFKQINDEFGHQSGDEALKKVALTIKESVRDEDIVARYGGEEFVILLREVSLKKSLVIAESIRQNVERLSYSDSELKTTVSIGIASWKDTYSSIEELVQEADRQLYKAKFCGRNQIQFSS